MKSFIQIKLNALSIDIILLYSKFLKKIFKKINLKFSIISLPKKIKKITLLKSSHVHKKAREQFEICKYSKIITIYNKISLKYFNYLILNKPKMIKIKLKKL